MTANDSCVVILQATKLAIERGLCADISRVVSSRKPDEEVEVRFGFVFDTKNHSGLGKDNARDLWYTLLKLLKGSDLYTAQPIEKTLSETYGSLRKITDLGIPGPVTFHDKKRIETLDVMNFTVDGVVRTVRLNRSTEKVRKDAKTAGRPDFSRVRTRVSFLSKDASHRFDLTYVTPSSYEVEIEYLKSVDLKSFFDPIKLAVYVVKGDRELITDSEFTGVIAYYNSFFAKEARFDPKRFFKRALPQPINLKKKHIAEMTAYSDTNKLNGTRVVGVIMNETLFVINMVGNVQKIASNLPVSLNGTIFDAEYFKQVVNAFDILFDRKKDVRGLNLRDRLSAIEKICNTANIPSLRVKTFFMGDMYQAVLDGLALLRSLPPEDNDGLIFTPVTEPYFNNHIYKWKPPSELTIDFQASNIGGNRYTLQVVDERGKLVTFAPAGFDGNITSSTELKGVGEYRWEGKTFELVRSRPDKDAPNFITIANDVWADIQDPITIEELPELFAVKNEERDAIRKYHNSIKRVLITEYLLPSEKREVLDLGAGKGGDLAKYQQAGIKKLWAVEPNAVFAAELVKRANEMKARHKLSYGLEVIPAKAQQTANIKAALKGGRVNAAASFFSLSFFFENELSLSELIRTLDETVDRHGLFIGSTIDGETVKNLLEGKKQVEFGPVRIVKQYQDFQGSIGNGKMISYIYQESATVADEQVEYLVDWAGFVKRLGEYGFELLKSDMFVKADFLSPEEKQVSGMYRTFAFRRKDIIKPAAKVVFQRKYLPTAPNQKTFKLTSTLNSIDELKNYNLVRTGTHGDGDCFFHGVYTAINPKYRTAKSAVQKEMVREFRRQLDADEKTWMTIAGGYAARIGKPEYPGFDTLFETTIAGDRSDEFNTKRDEISAALGIYGTINFLKEIRSRRFQDLHLSEYIVEIKKVFPGHITVPAKKEQAIAQLDTLIQMCVTKAHQNFNQRLQSCGVWVGEEMLEIVSDEVKRDIYILNDYDGSPYKTYCIHTKNRPSIILLYQGESHYECVGRQLENKTIQREFAPDDPLITEIRKVVC